MATYTANYQLKMPASTDVVDVDDFNGNAETLDTVLAELAESMVETYTGSSVPATSQGVNYDVYAKKIGSGGTKKISTLNAGDLVKLNENGVPKEFIFLEHNHYGKGEVTLLRKDTFSPNQWTGGSHHPTTDYLLNNCYNGSGMDMFCNTQYPMVLDPVIRASMIAVPIPTMRGSIEYRESDWDETIANLYRKCFLLSCAEVDFYMTEEGTEFEYLETETNRIAYHDETAVAVGWWLRSPKKSSYTLSYYVPATGEESMYNYAATYQAMECCPRPALALSSDIYVSSVTDDDGCYTVVGAPAVETYRKLDGAWMRAV